MAHSLEKYANHKVIVSLSGGVDSAVAAVLLANAGARVEALHMTVWEDDDGYCTAADDLQDARQISDRLEIPLHHVNFAKEYRERVFEYFLEEYRAGRTPNPDVLCNREIKFGAFRDYARRLHGEFLATGHYAQVSTINGVTALLKGADANKDQSYFLHSVSTDALGETIFPLGNLNKSHVRTLAREHGLTVHDKKDSTGICFIGERPFLDFLQTYIPTNPGPIRGADGRDLGTHCGLMYYTIGQRQGLGIGGRNDAGEAPWYVVDKAIDDNALIVDQGESPLLYSSGLLATDPNWIGPAPAGIDGGITLAAKIRYRQDDQLCTARALSDGNLRVDFKESQRAVAPGQYVVFYDGNRCLGGAVIDRVLAHESAKTRTLAATKC